MMAKGTFQIVAIIAAVALAGAVGMTVIATDGDSGSADREGGFLRQLHQLGHHLHGGGHHQDHMAEVIEQLELTPEQLQRLEKIHEIIGRYGSEGHGSMAELHEKLVAQFEQGHVETDEIRLVVDGHVDEMREMAYAVTDELIALVNGLDATQREIMLSHLQGNQEGHQLHGR